MRRLAFLVFGFVTLGCTNKLTGSLDLDGDKFTPTSCRSMQPMGAQGVELEDASGAKVRIAERTDGGADVFWFKKGADKGKRFGDCAKLELHRQSSTVNKVTNVEGSAKLDCKSGDGELSGKITFENCH